MSWLEPFWKRNFDEVGLSRIPLYKVNDIRKKHRIRVEAVEIMAMHITEFGYSCLQEG